MKLTIINAGTFVADGGAMFGVVPKVLWKKHYECDERNLCKIALRSLLVETNDRLILIDNGCGLKQNSKYMANNGIDPNFDIRTGLAEKGIDPNDITDMVFTHLHFDHCGGTTYFDAEKNLNLTFPNAKHWVSKQQWDNYLNPNIREGSTYFKENMMPAYEAGLVELIDQNTLLLDGFEMRLFYGHTPGQIIPYIGVDQNTFIYCGDLIPAAANIPLAWVSAYDTRPLVTIEEKEVFMNEVVVKNQILFFQHDYYTECATVKKTEKGFRINEKGQLLNFMH